MPEITIPDLDDIAFVMDCHNCDGVGKRWIYDSRAKKRDADLLQPCEHCAGTGRTLTPVGERLMAFLAAIGVTIATPDGWKALTKW